MPPRVFLGRVHPAWLGSSGHRALFLPVQGVQTFYVVPLFFCFEFQFYQLWRKHLRVTTNERLRFGPLLGALPPPLCASPLPPPFWLLPFVFWPSPYRRQWPVPSHTELPPHGSRASTKCAFCEASRQRSWPPRRLPLRTHKGNLYAVSKSFLSSALT